MLGLDDAAPLGNQHWVWGRIAPQRSKTSTARESRPEFSSSTWTAASKQSWILDPQFKAKL